jgi:hypothetical protein
MDRYSPAGIPFPALISSEVQHVSGLFVNPEASNTNSANQNAQEPVTMFRGAGPGQQCHERASQPSRVEDEIRSNGDIRSNIISPFWPPVPQTLGMQPGLVRSGTAASQAPRICCSHHA